VGGSIQVENRTNSCTGHGKAGGTRKCRKLKTHITTEMIEGIMQQKTQAMEKITNARETFQKFMET
jgi:hypothetical protein